VEFEKRLFILSKLCKDVEVVLVLKFFDEVFDLSLRH